jgi:copper transport protein
MSRRPVPAPARRRPAALLAGVVLLLAALGGVGIVAAPPALAHAALVASTPGDRALLTEAPSEVTLTFSERVGIGLGAVAVVDASGSRADVGEIGTDSEGTRVRVQLRDDLEQGSYLVTWRVMSLDSHAVSGGFTFSVGRTTAIASSEPPGRDPGVTWLQRMARFVLYAGVVALVGATGVLVLVWRRGFQRRSMRRLLVAGVAATAAGTVAGLLLQGPYAAALPISSALRPALVEEVLGTRFGQAAVVRLALLAVIAVPVLRWTRRAPAGAAGPVVGAVLAVALLVTIAVAGHAGAGSNVALAVSADAAHLAAGSLWVGGLLVLVLGLLRLGDDAEMLPALSRWSKVAATAVTVLVATGLFATWREVRELPALLPTDYGRWLVVKVGLVVAMLALGNAARLWIQRRMRSATASVPDVIELPAADGAQTTAGTTAAARAAAAGSTTALATSTPRPTTRTTGAPGLAADSSTPGVRTLRRGVAIEAALAAVVLAVTAVLVETMPAKDAYAPAYSETLRAGTVAVQADFEPARVGVDAVHIYVTDGTGRPVDVPEVTARMWLPGRVEPIDLHLEKAAAGHWENESVTVPYKGTWQLQIDVRTGDYDEASVTHAVPVR